MEKKRREPSCIFEYYQEYYSIQPQTERFGIEIETETKSIKDYKGALVPDNDFGGYKISPQSKFWVAKMDNSLRNFGQEYVLKTPHNYDGVLLALEEFKTIFSQVEFIRDAPSTSVHVHMNIQRINVRQLGNLIVLWILFENLLMEFSGPQRRSNLFTLPVRCAEGNVKNFVKLFTRLEQKNSSALSFNVNETKYAALNLSCLGTLGTVEARSFRGSTDTHEIIEWVSLLDSLYEYALRDISPLDILERYRRKGWEFLFDVFGEGGNLLVQKIDNPSDFITRNEFYAAIVGDCVKNWWEIDPVNLPPILKPKKRTSVFSDSVTLDTVAQTFGLDAIPTINITPTMADHPWGGGTVIVDEANELTENFDEDLEDDE